MIQLYKKYYLQHYLSKECWFVQKNSLKILGVLIILSGLSFAVFHEFIFIIKYFFPVITLFYAAYLIFAVITGMEKSDKEIELENKNRYEFEKKQHEIRLSKKCIEQQMKYKKAAAIELSNILKVEHDIHWHPNGNIYYYIKDNEHIEEYHKEINIKMNEDGDFIPENKDFPTGHVAVPEQVLKDIIEKTISENTLLAKYEIDVIEEAEIQRQKISFNEQLNNQFMDDIPALTIETKNQYYEFLKTNANKKRDAAINLSRILKQEYFIHWHPNGIAYYYSKDDKYFDEYKKDILIEIDDKGDYFLENEIMPEHCEPVSKIELESLIKSITYNHEETANYLMDVEEVAQTEYILYKVEERNNAMRLEYELQKMKNRIEADQLRRVLDGQPSDASVVGRGVVGGVIGGVPGAVIGAVSALDHNMKNKN